MAGTTTDPPSPLEQLKSVLPRLEQAEVADPSQGARRQHLTSDLPFIIGLLESPDAIGSAGIIARVYKLVGDVASELLGRVEDEVKVVVLQAVAGLAGAVNELVGRCRKEVDQREGGSGTSLTQGDEFGVGGLIGKREWKVGRAEIGKGWEKVGLRLWEGISDWVEDQRVEEKNAKPRAMVQQALYQVATNTFLDPGVLVYIRFKIGEILIDSTSKHPINKAHLRKLLPAARLGDFLNLSDDRGLCRFVIELAFRLSPSANVDAPEQKEWVKLLFPPSAFGTDANQMKNHFNNLNKVDFETGTVKLLNLIAVGHVRRATMFTTSNIRCTQTGSSNVTTFSPTGNEVSSAGGRPTLLNWYINQWSVSAVVENEEQTDDGGVEWIPYRFELPFEKVQTVQLVKNKDELTCQFTLASAPLHGHKPISVQPAHIAKSQSAVATTEPWTVLFTSHDDEGENERVIRKTLTHRAQLYPQLAVGPTTAPTPRKGPRASMTQPVLLPAPEVYDDASTSLPGSNDKEESAHSQPDEVSLSQVSASQSKGLKQRLEAVRGDLSQAGLVESSVPPTSTGPEADQAENDGLEAARLDGGDQLDQDFAGEVMDFGGGDEQDSYEPDLDAGELIEVDQTLHEVHSSVAEAVTTEAVGKNATAIQATNLAGKRQHSPARSVGAATEIDNEPSTQASGDEAVGPAKSAAAAPEPTPEPVRTRSSRSRSTSAQPDRPATPKPARRSTRRSAQLASAIQDKPTSGAGARSTRVKKAPAPRPKTPPRRRAPADKPTATAARPVRVATQQAQAGPATAGEQEWSEDDEKGESQAAQAKVLDGAEAAGGDGSGDEQVAPEPAVDTMPASSLPQPVVKAPQGKRYGKAKAKPIKSPVKRTSKSSATAFAKPSTSTKKTAGPDSVASSVTAASRSLRPRTASSTAKRAGDRQVVGSDGGAEDEDGTDEESDGGNDDDWDALPPHTVHASKKAGGGKRAASAKGATAPAKSASKSRAKSKPNAGTAAVPVTKPRGKTAPKKATMKVTGKGKGTVRASGDGTKKRSGQASGLKPLSSEDEPDEKKADGHQDEEGETEEEVGGGEEEETESEGDVSTDWEDITVTKAVKREQRAQRKRSTTIDSASTARASVKSKSTAAKSKVKAQPKSQPSLAKRPPRTASKAQPKQLKAPARATATARGKKRKTASESDDEVSEPIPGERRMARPLGRAAEQAMARQKHTDEAGGEHKAKKLKPIETFSQLIKQPGLPPKTLAGTDKDPQDTVIEEQEAAQEDHQVDGDSDGEGYQPPMEVDQTGALPEPASVADDLAEVTGSVEQLVLDPKKQADQFKSELTADDILRKTSDLSAEGLIEKRRPDSQSAGPIQAPGGRQSQLLVHAPELAGQLSPGSISAVKQLVAPTQSEDEAMTMSRKTTAESKQQDSQERPSSSKHASQLSAPLPAVELEDEIEEVDEDEILVEAAEQDPARQTAHDDGSPDGEVTAAEDGDQEEDPIRSGSAPVPSLPMPTPAQRSALIEVAPEYEPAPQPARAGPSQLVVPAAPTAAGDAQIPSPTKLSTIPEGSQSTVATDVQVGPAVLDLAPSTQESADVQMRGEGDQAVLPQRAPASQDGVVEEAAGDEGVLGADDSGYLGKEAEVEESSAERSASPPLVARQVQAKPGPAPPIPSTRESASTVRAKARPTLVPAVVVEPARVSTVSGPAPRSAQVPQAKPAAKPVAKPLPPAPVPKPAKRTAAVLDEPVPLEPFRPPQARSSTSAPVGKQKAAAKAGSRAKAVAPQAKPTASRLVQRAQPQAKFKGKDKAAEREVEFRERVSQIDLPTVTMGEADGLGQEESEVDELVERFGLGLSMGDDERDAAEEILNGLMATYVNQQRLRREAVRERFERTKRFLTEQVAVPLLSEIIDESAEIVGDIEAVVGRWKVMRQNADELCAWNERQGALLDAEAAKARARFGLGG